LLCPDPAASPPAGLCARDMTVAAWVNAAADSTTVLGDVISWFDPVTRNGFTLEEARALLPDVQKNLAAIPANLTKTWAYAAHKPLGGVRLGDGP